MSRSNKKAAAVQAVLTAASDLEKAEVALAQAVSGAVDRNEYRAGSRLDKARDKLVQAVRAWRLASGKKGKP
jgi:hypothetical protein